VAYTTSCAAAHLEDAFLLPLPCDTK